MKIFFKVYKKKKVFGIIDVVLTSLAFVLCIAAFCLPIFQFDLYFDIVSVGFTSNNEYINLLLIIPFVLCLIGILGSFVTHKILKEKQGILALIIPCVSLVICLSAFVLFLSLDKFSSEYDLLNYFGNEGLQLAIGASLFYVSLIIGAIKNIYTIILILLCNFKIIK